jgi:hypothetical protein
MRTYTKSKKWFVHSLSRNNNGGTHKDGACYSFRIVCFLISVTDLVKSSLFRIFLKKRSENFLFGYTVN